MNEEIAVEPTSEAEEGLGEGTGTKPVAEVPEDTQPEAVVETPEDYESLMTDDVLEEDEPAKREAELRFEMEQALAEQHRQSLERDAALRVLRERAIVGKRMTQAVVNAFAEFRRIAQEHETTDGLILEVRVTGNPARDDVDLTYTLGEIYSGRANVKGRDFDTMLAEYINRYNFSKKQAAKLLPAPTI